MGNKISPKALRVGYIQDWESRWYSPKDMPDLIEEDFRIRKFLKDRFRMAALSKVTIERTGKYIRVNLHTARPGVIIGKKGADIEELKKQVQDMTSSEATINVVEIKRPELDAQLVAESVAFQLEKQIAFRRAMKRAVERTMQAGAGGIKLMVAGRLGGAEIARTEWTMEGRVPLHTFRADIDYGFTEAHITMGRIGVKCWIFKKEFFLKSEADLIKEVDVKPLAALSTVGETPVVESEVTPQVAEETPIEEK
ncbi:MAG: 30S ribosomal protein S3 [Elusimicrobia bacterium]|nr:30S ribosomal protein S3 [Elusimicrobiota bacterium]